MFSHLSFNWSSLSFNPVIACLNSSLSSDNLRNEAKKDLNISIFYFSSVHNFPSSLTGIGFFPCCCTYIICILHCMVLLYLSSYVLIFLDFFFPSYLILYNSSSVTWPNLHILSYCTWNLFLANLFLIALHILSLHWND